MFTHDELKVKIEKYKRKLSNCSFVSDAESYAKKLETYEREFNYMYGGEKLYEKKVDRPVDDYEIWRKLVAITEKIDKNPEKTKKLERAITKKFEQLSEEGKKKYSRSYQTILSFYK